MASRILLPPAIVPQTTEDERTGHYRLVCQQNGAIFRGVQEAFQLRNGDMLPAVILFDGAYGNTLGLREPEFNAQAVREAVCESNRSFGEKKQTVFLEHRSGRGYWV
jgi:hypothetical protein